MSEQKLIVAGVIGVLGALTGAWSDHFLMSAAVPVDMIDSWAFFQELMRRVAPNNMRIGHYLGLGSIPLSMFGFWQIYRGFLPAGSRCALPLLWASIAICVLGVGYHVQLAYIGHGLQLEDRLHDTPHVLKMVTEMNQHFAALIVPLQHLIVGLLLFVSVWMFGFISTGKTAYPRWAALLSPLCVCSVLYGLSMAIDGPVGVFLAIAGLNLTSAIVFSISTLIIWKNPAGFVEMPAKP